jgi:hypothetical protein
MNTLAEAAWKSFDRPACGDCQYDVEHFAGHDQYHTNMDPPEIDPELNVRALEEAARRYPEFAGRALGVVARPLMRGFAWQVEWDGPPPSGEDAWEFQNTAIRAYKRLAEIA